ncbi:MAG TPA: HIT family protein [Polyangiaceae bacterium]|nr:HIT family protein [Polyangiaceae bacterium]
MTLPRCPFCAIVAGETPAHRVLEDDACVAFLDARPLFPGHILVVPREHRETMSDLKAPELAALFESAQVLCRAVESGLGAQGSFVAVNNRVSQSVPHAHVHVVPRNKGDGLRGFFWPRHKYASEEEAEEVAESLRAAIRRSDAADGRRRPR